MIPNMVYTAPEIASVGRTEAELKAQGIYADEEHREWRNAIIIGFRTQDHEPLARVLMRAIRPQ